MARLQAGRRPSYWVLSHLGFVSDELAGAGPSLESKLCAAPAQGPAPGFLSLEVFNPGSPDTGIRALMGKRPNNSCSDLAHRQENEARPPESTPFQPPANAPSY